MTRKDLQDLSRIRLSEAKSLLSAKYPDGAYYLAGYSVECGLKACISKSTRRYEFPDKDKVRDSYTHSFRDLLRVANLDKQLQQQAKSNPAFRDNWDLVVLWNERSRYKRYNHDAARALVEAVANIRHGVQPWLKHHW